MVGYWSYILYKIHLDHLENLGWVKQQTEVQLRISKSSMKLCVHHYDFQAAEENSN